MPTVCICDNPWHAEVWSAEGSAPSTRCWIALPPEVASARLLSPAIELPECGELDPRLRRFELPAPVGTLGHDDVQRVVLTFADGRTQDIDIRRPVDLPQPSGDMATDGPGVPAASVMVAHEPDMADLAEESLERHASFVAGLHTASPHSGSLFNLKTFVNAWTKAAREDARMSLIVEIAQRHRRFIEDLCDRPRRVLQRERERVPVERISQIDPTCIRWITRQPGRTLTEKAGPEQRLLGVTRRESTGTLENRVLRDFLQRATNSATRYTREYKRLGDNERVTSVGRARRSFRYQFRESAVAHLPALQGQPEPNYALMYDGRYRRLWPLYLRLRREERVRDDLWRWRHRAWAEIVLASTLVAIDELCASSGGVLMTGYVDTCSEQSFGRFIARESPFPVFFHAAAGGHAIDIIQPPKRSLESPPPARRPAEPGPAALGPLESRLRQVWQLGADFVVAILGVERPTDPPRLLAFFTEFSPTTADGIREQTQFVEKMLQERGMADCAAILVHPDLRGSSSVDSAEWPYCSTAACPSLGVSASTRQLEAKDTMIQIMAKFLK